RNRSALNRGLNSRAAVATAFTALSHCWNFSRSSVDGLTLRSCWASATKCFLLMVFLPLLERQKHALRIASGPMDSVEKCEMVASDKNASFAAVPIIGGFYRNHLRGVPVTGWGSGEGSCRK